MNQAITTITRRTFLALALGTGAAALSGCRRARADAVSPPASPTGLAGARNQGPGRSRADVPGRTLEQLTVDGVARRYVRYSPPNLDPNRPAPLVLVLHGRGGTGAIAEWMYGMSELAATHGFVVAYPDALGDPPTWHSGVGTGGRQGDDVAFVRALVGREAEVRPIDAARTFVCGHSSGAMMSYRLAAEAGDLFPAVGIVAGSAGFRLPNGRTGLAAQPERPVSVIHFHGTDDRLVPYNGGQGRAPGGFMSVADSIGLWVATDGCNTTPERETVGAARRETYTGGRDGTDVTLWTIEGGGHEWPKVNNPMSPSAGVSATELIWAYFVAHPRGAAGPTPQG